MNVGNKERNLKLFFAISLLCLFVQFYVYVNYTKFYPAIVMPMFGYGKFDMQNIRTSEPLVIVHFKNNDSIEFNHHSILGGMPKPIRTTTTHRILENEQLQLQQDTSFLNWFRLKIFQLSGRKDVSRVEFYKIDKTYSFADTMSCRETKRTRVQHLTL
jgi:hypothetical protein